MKVKEISLDQIPENMQLIIQSHRSQLGPEVKLERLWKDESGWVCAAYSNHTWFHYSSMGEWW